MTSGTRDSSRGTAEGEKILRVARAGLQSGGIDAATGSRSRWETTVAALRDTSAHVVLVQEMAAHPPHRLRAHLWRAANALGMTPVLGPPGPGPVPGLGNHPAILVAAGAGLRIIDDGSPLWGPGGGALPSWCHALVEVPGLAHPLAFYSAHLPARSAVAQLAQAEELASVIAQRGELTIAGGGWNCFSPADHLTTGELAAMPPQLRPSRLRRRADDGAWVPNYDVDDCLTGIGLVDVAADLPPGEREPAELTATAGPGGRIDRFYVTAGLDAAAGRYQQRDSGGSDHQMLVFHLDVSAAAELVPPGAVP
jgi:hypothetical protein